MPFQDIEKTIPGLIPGERYVIRVRAISSFGVTSEWSEAYEVNIDDAPTINDWLEQELTLHVNDPDPHDQYALADGSRGAFEEQGAVASHESESDPHDQYALADGTRGDYIPLSATYKDYFPVATVAEGSSRTLSLSFPTGTFSSAPYMAISPFCTSSSAQIGFHVTQVSSSSATVILRNNSTDTESGGTGPVDIGAYVMAIGL